MTPPKKGYGNSRHEILLRQAFFVTWSWFSSFLHGSTVVVPNPKMRTICRCECGSTRIVTRCRSCVCVSSKYIVVSSTTDYPMCNISMFAGAEFQDWRRMLNLKMSLILVLYFFEMSGSSTEGCWYCFFIFFRNICLLVFHVFREHLFTYGPYLLYQCVPKP